MVAGDPSRIGAPRPVLVASMPRSGSTWVARVLSKGARYVPEPDNAERLLSAMTAKAGLGAFPILGLGDRADHLQDLWEKAFEGRRPRRGSTLTARAARRVHHRLSADHVHDVLAGRRPTSKLATRLGASQRRAEPPFDGPVLVKSVFCGLSMPWMAEHFDVAVVVLHRHPYGVIGSIVDLAWGFEGVAWESPRLAELAARYDVPVPIDAPVHTQAAFLYGLITEQLGSVESVARVTHEELVRDPEASFTALSQTLGLDAFDVAEAIRSRDREGSEYAANRRLDSEADGWRRRLPSELRGAVVETLEHFPTVQRRYPDLPA